MKSLSTLHVIKGNRKGMLSVIQDDKIFFSRHTMDFLYGFGFNNNNNNKY